MKRETGDRLAPSVETDAYSDSDVDSDIGEIRKATSSGSNASATPDDDADNTLGEEGSFVISIIRE